MKRYAKHARPLWGRGARKPQASIVYVYGPLRISLEGEDITGATVRESFEWPDGGGTVTSETKFKSAPRIILTQSKMRADIKIKLSFGLENGPALAAERVSFTTAGHGPTDPVIVSGRDWHGRPVTETITVPVPVEAHP